MIRNYLKIAWRILRRNTVYSVINIAGLGIGLAACMLIVLYVGHESSYNSIHENANRIYWVQGKIKMGNDSLFMPNLTYSSADYILQSETSVQSFLRIKHADQNTIVQNPRKPEIKFAEDRFLFADSNFFRFFSFELLAGNKNNVLENPFSVVISRNAAKKYFGDDDPIGKTIRFNNDHTFTITGISKETPSNSSIVYDFVASLTSLPSMPDYKSLITTDENAFSTYFQLSKGGNIASVETGLAQRHGEKVMRYVGIPITDLHLASDSNAINTKYLHVFPFIAGLILLLALINYISLTTARSTIRSREIGIRKVLGANRKTIALQFFAESALYTSIAFLLGFILCSLVQPFFFNFLQIDIDSSFLYHPFIILSFAGLFILSVVLAASYPSILLSAYKPVLVLYGKVARNFGDLTVRKFFTVFQFTISVVLIVCGLVIDKQIHFIKHADTGVKRQNVIMIPFGLLTGEHYSAFKNEIHSLPAIQQSSTSLHPLYKGYDIMAVRPQGSQQVTLLPTLYVDQHFISLLGLQWKVKPADSLFYRNKNSIILNETAVEKLDLGSNPLNTKIDNQFEVRGILKDFNFASLQNKIDGLGLFITSENDTASLWTSKGGCVFARINPNANIPSLVEQLKTIHQKYDRENPFEYYFMDEAFDAMYKAEDRLLRILSVFIGFTVLIAALGLFGLATFMAARRTKEIGIRKVLGASFQQVVTLLVKDFIGFVLIAIVIAAPVAWTVMEGWLQNFSYRANISWDIFAMAGSTALLIASLSVGFLSIKAALANPVKSLKTE